jgi:CubicO group peptidase (beta-lactamase class C family)
VNARSLFHFQMKTSAAADRLLVPGAHAMRTLLALTLALLLAPLMARADDWQTSSPETQGMSSRALADLVAFGIFNGMDSALVVRHGRIVAEAYYAPFTPGLRHRINSSTKAVIGSLVAIALKDGLLKSLDQPVLDFFPGRTFDKLDERKKAITLRHLLDTGTRRSAARSRGRCSERSADWVQFVLDRAMAREPGAAFNYNSGNPHLLSAILSKATGKSAEDYAREKLFGPLGISDVFWRRDPQGVSTGGFGLYLQPRDMAKLGQLWLHDGVRQGERLLPTGWIDKVRQAKIDMGLPNLRYANLFWSMPSKDVFMAVGFHRQLIMVLPALDMVAVFTGAMRYSNAEGMPSSPGYSLGAIADRLKDAVKSDQALPEDPEALALLAAKTKEVAQEARTQAAGTSPLAAAISGKLYRLQPNQLRYKSLSLTFENRGAAYAYEFDGQRLGGPIGLDGLYGVGGRRVFGISAAKGQWLDDKTFQLDVQTLGNDDAGMATFTFDGKSLSGRLATLGGFKAELQGEAD